MLIEAYLLHIYICIIVSETFIYSNAFKLVFEILIIYKYYIMFLKFLKTNLCATVCRIYLRYFGIIQFSAKWLTKT